MKKELYITIGFIIIFVATTLGSGLVFILNRKNERDLIKSNGICNIIKNSK